MRLVKGYVLPSMATVLLHAAILWLMGENWNLEKPERYVKPRMINARLVTLEQPKPASAPKPAPRPQVKPKQPPAKPPPVPKSTPPVPKKPVASKPKSEPDPAKQREQQQRREREIRETQLAKMMAEEEAFLEAQSREELAMSHIGAIQQAVAMMWSRPPSARRNMEVSLLISLIPTGEVVSVRILKSSGNNAFDRSAVNAVNKAARFPELAELPPNVFEKYFRELRLVFRPEDLRL